MGTLINCVTCAQSSNSNRFICLFLSQIRSWRFSKASHHVSKRSLLRTQGVVTSPSSEIGSPGAKSARVVPDGGGQVEQVQVLDVGPFSDASSRPSCVLRSGARGCSSWWPRNPACSWRRCTSRRICAALGGSSVAADGMGCCAPKHGSVRAPAEWQATRRLSAAQYEGRQRV